MSDMRTRHKIFLQAGIAFILIMLIAGCGGTNPVSPAQNGPAVNLDGSQNSLQSDGRYVWGNWDISIDTADMTWEVIPGRMADVHYNILQMLEGWACTNCVFVDGLAWSDEGNLLVDIGITHPYDADRLDLTGRDVRGIAIFDGVTNFPYHFVRDENGVEQPLLASRKVLNADGYTTHFNRWTANEGNGIFDYRRGKMTWEGEEEITGNLHPFRYFYTYDYKRLFYPGQTIIETYEIAIGFQEKFRFAYSVDASWNYPMNWPVINPITDFNLSANAREAYQISMYIDDNSLTRQGGSADLSFDIFDHQNYESISTISIEAPDLFDNTMSIDPGSPVMIDSEMARYTVTIQNKNGHAKVEDGGSDILIVVEDSAMSIVGEDVRAYGVFTLPVEDVPMSWRFRKNGTFFNVPFPGPAPSGPNFDFTVIRNPQEPWAFEPGEPMLVFPDDANNRYIAYNRDFDDWKPLSGYPGNWLKPTARIDSAAGGGFGVVSESDFPVEDGYLVKHCTNANIPGGIYSTSWYTGSLNDAVPFLELAGDVSGGWGDALGDPIYTMYIFDSAAGYPQPGYTSLHRIGSPYYDPSETLRALLPLSADLSNGIPPNGISFNHFTALGIDDDPIGEANPFVVHVYTAETRPGFGNTYDREMDIYKVNFSVPLGFEHIQTYRSNQLGGLPSSWPPTESPKIVDIEVLPALTNEIYMGDGDYAEHNWVAVLYSYNVGAFWFIEIFDIYSATWQTPIYTFAYPTGHAYAMEVDAENFEIYVLHDDMPLGTGLPSLTSIEYY